MHIATINVCCELFLSSKARLRKGRTERRVCHYNAHKPISPSAQHMWLPVTPFVNPFTMHVRGVPFSSIDLGAGTPLAGSQKYSPAGVEPMTPKHFDLTTGQQVCRLATL